MRDTSVSYASLFPELHSKISYWSDRADQTLNLEYRACVPPSPVLMSLIFTVVLFLHFDIVGTLNNITVDSTNVDRPGALENVEG